MTDNGLCSDTDNLQLQLACSNFHSEHISILKPSQAQGRHCSNVNINSCGAHLRSHAERELLESLCPTIAHNHHLPLQHTKDQECG